MTEPVDIDIWKDSNCTDGWKKAWEEGLAPLSEEIRAQLVEAFRDFTPDEKPDEAREAKSAEVRESIRKDIAAAKISLSRCDEKFEKLARIHEEMKLEREMRDERRKETAELCAALEADLESSTKEVKELTSEIERFRPSFLALGYPIPFVLNRLARSCINAFPIDQAQVDKHEGSMLRKVYEALRENNIEDLEQYDQSDMPFEVHSASGLLHLIEVFEEPMAKVVESQTTDANDAVNGGIAEDSKKAAPAGKHGLENRAVDNAKKSRRAKGKKETSRDSTNKENTDYLLK